MPIDVGYSQKSVKVSDVVQPFTGVTLTVDGNKKYVAGNSTGRMMEVSLAMGSQETAEAILRNASGYMYKSFSAQRAVLDPAVELGDKLQIAGIGERLYSQEISFGRLFSSNIAAPGEAELEHEFQYEAPERRQYNRGYAGMSGAIAQLKEDFNQCIAEIEGISAGLTAYVREDELEGLLAETEVYAKIYDEFEEVYAGLKLKAESSTVEDLEGRVTTTETAQASLSARVGNAEASISLKASSKSVTDLEGRVTTVESSTATLKADVIELQGRVDLTGILSISQGALSCSGAIYAPGQLISGLKGSFNQVVCTTLSVADVQYSPTTITSSSGAKISILGT